MPATDAPKLLSLTEFAHRLGLQDSRSLSGYALPEPDLTAGGRRFWTEHTIDTWHANRPGRGNWSTPSTKNED